MLFYMSNLKSSNTWYWHWTRRVASFLRILIEPNNVEKEIKIQIVRERKKLREKERENMRKVERKKVRKKDSKQ